MKYNDDMAAVTAIALATALGFVGLFWFLSVWRRGNSGIRPTKCDDSPDEIRRKRLARLSAPGDLDESWQSCFLDTDLAETLKLWRKQPFPTGALLVLLVEGDDSNLPTQRLKKFVWPVIAKGLLSRSPSSINEALAARLQLSSETGATSKNQDGEFLLSLFGMKREAAPVVFFMWGATPIHAAHLQNGITPEAFQKLIADARARARQSWSSLGWDGAIEPGELRGGGRIVEMKDLEGLRSVENLHRKMAEDLLAAHSAAQAKDLVRRGIANPRDFVIEDVGVSLDTDQDAAVAREEHVAEQSERSALRASQSAEFAESERQDAMRRAAEAARAAEEAKQAEDEEARMVWAQMDKAHRLEQLPQAPEPEATSSGGALLLTVVLPCTGRKLSRRWRPTDLVSSVADFAFGSADESELPYTCGVPSIIRSFPRCSLQPDTTLQDAGITARETLHAVIERHDPATSER